MAIDVSNIRTMQDVINVLSILYFNMNEVERVYYDIFINPTPMDVELQRYNEEGVLESIKVPNRAKMALAVLTGEGNPTGKVEANIGELYLDTDSGNLYYKAQDSGSSAGWSLIWSNSNLQENRDFLPPNGSASQLYDVNVSNAIGMLKVSNGGSQVGNITGIIRGNGTNPYSQAIDGTDYLGPNSMTGLIAYYPMYDGNKVNNGLPNGWLRCDGSEISRSDYSKLFGVIGTLYGAGDGVTTFNIPDFTNYFIRCWDGNSEFNTTQEAQVGGHTHDAGTLVTSSSGANHKHGVGGLTIKGEAKYNTLTGLGESPTGALSGCTTYNNRGYGDTMRGRSAMYIKFLADKNHGFSGSTDTAESSHTHTISGATANNDTGAENRVLNKMLVPIIKY